MAVDHSNLGLWPPKVCPSCGEEYDHDADCQFLRQLSERQERAKDVLRKYDAQTIADLLALVDMAGCDSLYGDVWRMLGQAIEALKMHEMMMDSHLKTLSGYRESLEESVKRLEAKWLNESET